MYKYKFKKILVLDNINQKLHSILSVDKHNDFISYTSNINDAFEAYRHNFYNLVIINISHIKSLELIRSIKKISKNKAIILISDDITDTKQLNLFSSFYVDGILFSPFLNKNLFDLMDNIFERQEEQDSLFTFLKDIEKTNEIVSIEPKQIIEEKFEYIPTIENYDEILTPVEFFEIFDDSIIDKVEDLHSLINELSETIFFIEEHKESPFVLLEHLHKLSIIFKNIADALYYFQYFKIAGKAFVELSSLFDGLEISEKLFHNRAKLVEFLSLMCADLEAWFFAVFMDRTAKNIYYFDSSFLSNVSILKNLIVVNGNSLDNKVEFF